MPKGKFEFDIRTSPQFSLSELKRLKHRAMAEPFALEQSSVLNDQALKLAPGMKVDALLLTGLTLIEFALHVMKEREASQVN
jgi:hypothetical protein